MIAYKLLRVRKDGTIGSLFINRQAKLPLGKWLQAGDYKTNGYKHRPGWHCLAKPVAPHLKEEGRRWYKVEISGISTEDRPESQGGTWYLARRMKILSPLEGD